MTRLAVFVLIALLLVLAGGAPSTGAAPGAVEMVSVTSGEALAKGISFAPNMSADGRFVSFTSVSPNFAFGDVNNANDVFLRDRIAGTTEAVSLTPTGVTGNGPSFRASRNSQTDDGRYVVFWTMATNMGSGGPGVYLRDRVAGISELISVSTGGAPANAQSEGGWISQDGRYVLFQSLAANLAPGDSPGTMDTFVRDRTLGTTTIVSVTDTGAVGDGHSVTGELTADGRYVLFQSQAANLWGAEGDPNPGNLDLFVRDLEAGTTTGVELTPGSGDAYPGIPEAARYYAWVMQAGEPYHVYVRDLVTGTDEQVDVSTGGTSANQTSAEATITPDGRYVIFSSFANNLVASDTNGFKDVFRHDRQTGETIRVSVSGLGAAGNSFSQTPDISDDGLVIAFASRACNLAPQSDSNQAEDIFVHDLSGVGLPQVDPDCDGFTTAEELFLGTDPALACAGTRIANDETGLDKWPLDLDDSNIANTIDVGHFVAVLNKAAPGPPYSVRLDLNGNGTINVVDIGRYPRFLNRTCVQP